MQSSAGRSFGLLSPLATNWAPGDAEIYVNTTDHWTANGNSENDPPTASLPVINTLSLTAKSQIMPGAGTRLPDGRVNLQGGTGLCWSAIPSSYSHSYDFRFTATYVNPVYSTTTSDHGFSIRCVRP